MFFFVKFVKKHSEGKQKAAKNQFCFKNISDVNTLYTLQRQSKFESFNDYLLWRENLSTGALITYLPLLYTMVNDSTSVAMPYWTNIILAMKKG